MRHAFVHFDLNTSDFAGARRFYEALFDWDFVDVDMGGNAPYAQIRPPSGPGGGLQPTTTRGTRSQWVPYVGVDDLRAMLERVREAGGTVIVDYTEVPGFGAQAIVQDPGGTQLGLWEMPELEPGPVVEEVVEAEIVEDAEVVEEAVGPEVVVDAPVAVEVAVAAEAPAVDEPATKKASKKTVKEVMAAARAAKAAKKAAKEAMAAAPATKTASKKTAKKIAVEEPVAKKAGKKVANKPVVEEPAAKKTARKQTEAPAAKKTAAGRGRR